ncbi:hypothetical protein BDF14DRAFT_1766916, partial [Spinellus fusiger]
MTNISNRIYLNVSLVIVFTPALVGLYAVNHHYSGLSQAMFTLSAVCLGLSTTIFTLLKAFKHGIPVLLFILRSLNQIFSPMALYLSQSTLLGPVLSIMIRVFFFVGFIILLMSDQCMRGIVGRCVGKHSTKRNLTIINAMHTDFSFSDHTLPHTERLETKEHTDLHTKTMTNKEQSISATDMPKIPHYSLSLAYTLSVASKLVYEDIEVIKYELEKYGFDVQCTFRPIAYQNICAFIIEKENDIILVFRGTNPLNIQNYLTNINIGMGAVEAPWGPMGKVHKGYWSAMGDPLPCNHNTQLNDLSLKTRVQIELTNTSVYQTVLTTCIATAKVFRFFIYNLFYHVKEPIDSTWLGPEVDIRSHSMYSQAEHYIMELVQSTGINDENGVTKESRDVHGCHESQKEKRLFITGHSLGGALATS